MAISLSFFACNSLSVHLFLNSSFFLFLSVSKYIGLWIMVGIHIGIDSKIGTISFFLFLYWKRLLFGRLLPVSSLFFCCPQMSFFSHFSNTRWYLFSSNFYMRIVLYILPAGTIVANVCTEMEKWIDSAKTKILGGKIVRHFFGSFFWHLAFETL